jgi:hypothetical protein
MTLAEQLEKMVADAVRTALVAERPRLVLEIRREIERAEPASWSPADVRRHAGCRKELVFTAIANGELPAVRESVPARANGKIPAVRYRIRPADARVWAESRRRGKGGAA